ncbi:MAG: DNA recombination protein RmuC [Patescibacteria group bacterium]|nr:DNA recombination protein RmuC [Patescibacteria group bacterium]
MGTQEILIIIGFLAILALAAAIWLKLSGLEKQSSGPGDMQALTLIQQQMAQLQQELGGRMNETNRAFLEQNRSVTNIVKDITGHMSKVEEISRQVLSETTELQKLQQILKNPKQRGVLGEYFLENLLKNVLPPDNYQMQYRFNDGEIVDAVVFVKDKIVPIDSKFSLENYNRLAVEENPAERVKLEKEFVNDLKKRVVETSKYIRPNEGTMDFAFMFIPHEAIYYDLLVNKIGVVGEETENIIQRAASKHHVLVVSPTSFLAYLQTVLQGLRALKIEEEAREIQKRVDELKKHLAAYEKCHVSLGSHLQTAVNQYNLSSKEYLKIDKDIYRITGSSTNPELPVLEGREGVIIEQ